MSERRRGETRLRRYRKKAGDRKKSAKEPEGRRARADGNPAKDEGKRLRQASVAFVLTLHFVAHEADEPSFSTFLQINYFILIFFL